MICITGRDDDESLTFMNLEFNDSMPRNPVVAYCLDYLEVILARKIADVLNDLDIKDVSFAST